ncbi:MAG TPA: 4'-phosphopantetheinyl transferase superfamily protein [Solirubrobacteraceae bacterium]|jgi:4'-phosphopantetheinyl transferase
MGSTDAVDVWVVNLDQVPTALREVLSEQERDRAAAIRDVQGQARWSACRTVLRVLLGERLDADPRALAFELGPNGKPRLPADLHFNLSHSGPTALYALASDREVGVDVERADRRRPSDELAVAKRMLGSASEQRLASLPAEERFVAFLREWTALEARAKCLGIGLGEAKDDAAGEELGRLWVCDLDVSGLVAGERLFAALAVEGGPAQICMRAWEEA